MKRKARPRRSTLPTLEKRLRRERARLRQWEQDLRRWEGELKGASTLLVRIVANADAQSLQRHRSRQARVMARAATALASGQLPSFLAHNPARPGDA